MRFVALAAALAATLASANPAAPVAMSITTSTATDDPYLWLEDVQGDKAMAWVKEENARSQPVIEGTPGFKPLLAKLTEVANSRDRIPPVTDMGGQLYNFWQDASNPRGLWRRTTLAEYRKAQPAWETVIDLDKLSADEKEQWAWKGATCLYPERERCLVSLSKGGSDAVEVREFDLVQKAFVAGGFRLPTSKGGVAWIDRDTIYASRDWGPGTMTRSGYPRQVKVLKRGEDPAKAPVVFAATEEEMGVWPAVINEKDGSKVELLRKAISTRKSEFFAQRGGRFVRVPLQDTADPTIAGGWAYVRVREDWTVGATTYKAGTLLAIEYEKLMGGSTAFETVFTPKERVSLADVDPLKSMVILKVLDNVASKLYEAKRSADGKWSLREVATPKLATLTAGAMDRRESDDYQLYAYGFTMPTTLFLAKGGSDAREQLKATPAFFDATGLVVTQHEATSRDGTKIPYFQVMREGAKLDGNNPTILYGYGGFEISMTPSYSAYTGNGWLAKGGVWVLANLRGGGEFGPNWNQVARRDGRQKTYDDFIAVAEDLIARKVTSPTKLGILGGSQGGLLVGGTVMQRPELFHAAVATVPLMDMKRYHKLLAGASWMGEYGDPDNAADWAFISKYSPYQNVKKDAKYPHMLITTSTRDDRVHPGHARKMAALMQSMGHPTTYFEYTEGGHGAGTTPAQTAYTWAFIYTYFARELM